MTEAAAAPVVVDVVLGGKSWPIPELVPRQLRLIRAELIEMTRRLNADPKAFGALSNADYETMLLRVVHVALTRSNPELTEAAFFDLPATEAELIEAWNVVQRQSGLFVFEKKGSGGDAPEGEAGAAATAGTSIAS